MSRPSWKPGAEIAIYYDPKQYELYRCRKPECEFHSVRWPLQEGRGRFGEFPLVVAREYFRRLGYTVRASEPRLPGAEGFILVAYPGKREARDPAYRRMEAVFGARVLAELNTRTDKAKRRHTGNRAGGDPDLFVVRRGDPKDRFFVEVKHHDHITMKQSVTFPLIEELCPIKIARLVAIGPADRRRRAVR